MSVTSTNIIAGISIHAPSRERPQSLLIHHSNHHFNPRSLTGATFTGSSRPIVGPFQSTLPHGSDQLPIEKYMQAVDISIHAPSRERPSHPWIIPRSLQFQSTLPHGSDPTMIATIISQRYFNPRSLTGATRTVTKNSANISYFNPRSLTGATAESVDSSLQPSFQSTLPHGSDREVQGSFLLKLYFNPRSLTGATDDHIRWSPVTGISIHAPSRERRITTCLVLIIPQFQSTLPHGSDSLDV